jgi:hypothetical protein
MSGAEFFNDSSVPKLSSKSEVVAEAELSVLRNSDAEGGSSSSTVVVPDVRQRCAECFALFSVVLQAMHQTDEALRQPGVFASEEDIRWQLVTLAQPLRNGSPLAAKWRERLAFHGLRLYLLISRSSHSRRQYVVLQRPFVEEEQRMIAFFLSIAPPSQQSCVLLRAMAQDVHSWLLWQAQAPPTSSAARSTGPAPIARPPRQRRRRTEKNENSLLEARSTSSRSAKELPSTVSFTPELGAAAEGSQSVQDEDGKLARIFSVESGEAVWLVHSLLLLGFVLCLLGLWYSLEQPRGSNLSGNRDWKIEL